MYRQRDTEGKNLIPSTGAYIEATRCLFCKKSFTPKLSKLRFVHSKHGQITTITVGKVRS